MCECLFLCVAFWWSGELSKVCIFDWWSQTPVSREPPVVNYLIFKDSAVPIIRNTQFKQTLIETEMNDVDKMKQDALFQHIIQRWKEKHVGMNDNLPQARLSLLLIRQTLAWPSLASMFNGVFKTTDRVGWDALHQHLHRLAWQQTSRDTETLLSALLPQWG